MKKMENIEVESNQILMCVRHCQNIFSLFYVEDWHGVE